VKRQAQPETHPKARRTRKTPTTIRKVEREYRQMFTPHPLPYQGLYTDEDSLEQPSELIYVPATSSPHTEG